MGTKAPTFWYQRKMAAIDPSLNLKLPIRCTTVRPVICPRVFTKNVAPLIARLRLLRVQLYAYLNDLLIVGDSGVEATQSTQETFQVLIHAGFIVNLKKSELAPTQDLVYMGAWCCTDLGRLYLPEKLIQALTACARSFSKDQHTNS